MSESKPVRASSRQRLLVEHSRKRVRTYLHGKLVADTTRPLLVWENPQYPTYYLPAVDIAAQLVTTGHTDHTPRLGDVEVFDVVAGDATAPGAARRVLDPPDDRLREAVRLEWPAMTEWLEEDESVYVHPRDPYTRIDILASSRHVRVELDGVTLAETDRPTILFETGLPPRYYLPPADVRTELLRPSPRHTGCPYKGTASYWSVEVNGRRHDDLVWTYRTPLPESHKIAGLVCFYDERIDLYLDGELQERPRTKFSQRATP
jgi:uncharacterized protein (DUF427 family)